MSSDDRTTHICRGGVSRPGRDCLGCYTVPPKTPPSDVAREFPPPQSEAFFAGLREALAHGEKIQVLTRIAVALEKIAEKGEK
jgi:hypothetical protein